LIGIPRLAVNRLNTLIFAKHVGNQLNQLPNTQGLQESGGCGAKQLRDGQGEEQTQQATPDIERLFFWWLPSERVLGL